VYVKKKSNPSAFVRKQASYRESTWCTSSSKWKTTLRIFRNQLKRR